MRTALQLSVPLLALNEPEASTVDAMASRIFPADEGSGGAHEAEVIVYIDRTLAGHSRHLQPFYHAGIRELDNYCSAGFGRPFAELSEAEQDEVLGLLDTRKVALGELGQGRPDPDPAAGGRDGREPSGTLQIFFDVVWEHSMQGLFGDPVYGGNKDALGWRVVGFPGAQWSYSAEQRDRGFDATSIPVRTLADLQRERPWAARHGLGVSRGDGDAAST